MGIVRNFVVAPALGSMAFLAGFAFCQRQLRREGNEVGLDLPRVNKLIDLSERIDRVRGELDRLKTAAGELGDLSARMTAFQLKFDQHQLRHADLEERVLAIPVVDERALTAALESVTAKYESVEAALGSGDWRASCEARLESAEAEIARQQGALGQIGEQVQQQERNAVDAAAGRVAELREEMSQIENRVEKRLEEAARAAEQRWESVEPAVTGMGGLHEELATLAKQIRGVEQQQKSSAPAAQVEALEARLNAMEMPAAASVDLTPVASQIDSLQQAVEDMAVRQSEEIAALRESDAGLQESLNTLAARHEQSFADVLRQAKEEQEAAVAALAGKLQVIEEAHGATQSRIETLAGEVAVLQSSGAADTLAAQLNELRSSHEEMSARLDEVGERIAGTSGAAAADEAPVPAPDLVAAIEEQLRQIETAHAATAARLEELGANFENYKSTPAAEAVAPAEFQALSGQVRTLQTAHAAALEKIGELTERLTAAETTSEDEPQHDWLAMAEQVNAIEAAQSAASRDLAALAERLDSQQSVPASEPDPALATLADQIRFLESSHEAAAARLTEIASELKERQSASPEAAGPDPALEEMAGQLRTIEAAQEAAAERLGTLESRIEAIPVRVESVATTVEDLASRLHSVESRPAPAAKSDPEAVTEIRTQLASLSERVSGIEARLPDPQWIGIVSDCFTALEERITEQSEKLRTVEKSYATIDRSIDQILETISKATAEQLA